jgi:hypothetical protein
MQEFSSTLDTRDGKNNIFRVAKQMVNKNKDVTNINCLKNAQGSIIYNTNDMKDAWKVYMEKLLNEENEWENTLDCDVVQGQYINISEEEVSTAIKSLKLGKSGGRSEVVAELFKGAGDTGVKVMQTLCNSVLEQGEIPGDWCQSVMCPIYKGKGDALSCGSYRGIKLLAHGLKIFECILNRKLRQVVKINDSQFGFVPGRGTTDAIFLVRQIQESIISKERKKYFGFVDLEKAFDRVPRDVVRWALRKEGVSEYLVRAVMSTYEKARTVVRVGNECTEEFDVKVGVHQGSVLSPLLFIIVMQAITKNISKGLPWEILYADDLVIVTDSEKN